MISSNVCRESFMGGGNVWRWLYFILLPHSQCETLFHVLAWCFELYELESSLSSWTIWFFIGQFAGRASQCSNSLLLLSIVTSPFKWVILFPLGWHISLRVFCYSGFCDNCHSSSNDPAQKCTLIERKCMYLVFAAFRGRATLHNNSINRLSWSQEFVSFAISVKMQVLLDSALEYFRPKCIKFAMNLIFNTMNLCKLL